MFHRRSTLIISFALISLAAPGVRAQDTPTEREAARDVLKKMADLEQSLDVPGWVSRLTGPDVARDQVVARAKELMTSELIERELLGR